MNSREKIKTLEARIRELEGVMQQKIDNMNDKASMRQFRKLTLEIRFIKKNLDRAEKNLVNHVKKGFPVLEDEKEKYIFSLEQMKVNLEELREVLFQRKEDLFYFLNDKGGYKRYLSVVEAHMAEVETECDKWDGE